MLSVMPLFHGFGLGVGIHAPLINGGTCILVPPVSYTHLDVYKRQLVNFTFKLSLEPVFSVFPGHS